MSRARKVAKKVLPPGSRRRIAMGRTKRILLGSVGIDSKGYSSWIKKVESKQAVSPIVKNGPSIGLVIPTYNTPDIYIKPLMKCLVDQTYDNWKLYIVDGSTDMKRASAIRALCVDDRIVYTKLAENHGISGNTNAGLKLVKESYVGFIDHDDVLPIEALNEVAHIIKEDPKTDLIYSDEDKISNRGSRRSLPFFKPDWSPDLLHGVNYMAHFIVVRRSLLNKVGGLRSEFDGAQDYDFLLRLSDQKPRVKHINKVLYHWRTAKGSTAGDIGQKSYADSAGRRALQDYVDRNNISADVVSIKDRPTNYRLSYKVHGDPLVSIVIPFKDKVELLRQCVTSITTRSTYKNYEIILLSNSSVKKETKDYLDKLKSNRIKKYNYDKPFNYSAINNFGRQKAKGEVLIFLNNDTKIITPTWIEELAGVALRKNVGAVGAMLLYPDKTVQHAGVVLGMTGMAGHVFRGLRPGTLTPYGLPDWPRNYLAVTGACLAVETKKFDEVSGFDEDFIIAGSDVSLCLDLFNKGYDNVYWPYARIMHHESKSVISYKNAPITDYDNSLIRYKPFLDYQDPYFNKNLDIMIEVPTVRQKYE